MSSPRICLSLYGTTDEICEAIREHDADLFEIRLDLSSNPDGSTIRACTRKPLLIAAHGRPDLLEKYWPFADFVDVEQADAIGQNTIVSIHSNREDVDALWSQYSGEHITKIVLETENYDAITRLLELNRQNKPLAILFASGEVGSFSRIASTFHGARWIYASLEGRSTAPGQFTYDQLMDAYKIRRLDTNQDVSIFGIIGNPVSHSRSPEFQNRKFAEASLPWIYLPFLCKDLPALFRNAPRWNTKGFSITHPHKEAVLELLDSVTPEVERLRSCNTVAYVEGKWMGTNTDWIGLKALLAELSLKNMRAVILGAGASARLFASMLHAEGANLVILNRNAKKAEELALQFGAKAGPLEHLKDLNYDLLIQATPVGWSSGELPVDPAHLREGKIVIDCIYKDTALLQISRQLGCATLNGEKWFEAQAEAQFEFWQQQVKS